MLLRERGELRIGSLLERARVSVGSLARCCCARFSGRNEGVSGRLRCLDGFCGRRACSSDCAGSRRTLGAECIICGSFSVDEAAFEA